MALGHLLGFRDVDVLGGVSLPVRLQQLDAERRPKRASEADKHYAQIVTEQRVINEQDRLAMLQRIETRQQALVDQAYSPERNQRLDRLEQARMLLYPKKGLDDD